MRGEAQARGWQGRLRTHLGDARGARESVRALAELAASAPTLVSSGEESLLRGRLAELVGSRTEALELYRKALAAWRRSWSPLGQARAHLAMGRVLLRQDRRPEAIEHLDRACEVGEEAGAPAIQLPATIARAIADEDLEAAAALLHEREHELGPRLRLEFHFALHRAGADFVMSLATLGANAIVHYLNNHQTALLAEGLNVFRSRVGRGLVGKSLIDSGIRQKTGCSVAAIDQEGSMAVNPDPSMVLSADAELVLIGSHEGEKAFHEIFGLS